MKPQSKSDWERVKREIVEDAPIPRDPDADLYNPNDPDAVAAFFATARKRKPGQRGEQKAPRKIATAIRLSPEVVEFFKSGGSGWQTRVDAALLEYVKTHSQS